MQQEFLKPGRSPKRPRFVESPKGAPSTRAPERGAPERGAPERAEAASPALCEPPLPAHLRALRHRRILFGLACGLSLLLLLTLVLGLCTYHQGYFGATRGYGEDIAKFGYSRIWGD